ncbi:MAG: hypothetical protein US96_C0006G0005 [Candidatus Woesebacteria bacterium GW2011_GWB1_38_5b]|uniref:Glycosyltransferase RgtA/B/C/D-like domain-containing protein n=1 Tax=Candidatus Woesebacteria bacterium GW2011_GWB1_38_5b TaxID=1618569 RepID=A0A0G0K7R3_9BACT|nr:MAG: hypothetical protein US96_C0006G0005 [Candidatus Woesebacteria bacterium GW2011_GWB1_38_5b]
MGKGMGKKLIIIIVVAFALRLININQSLWLDEAIGAIAARDFTYSEIITRFIIADNHSPGYYLLLKSWTNIFGFSEMALRSLSVVFGVLTVYLVYKTNKVAALLLATSQLHVYYSQEARMYAIAGFFATLAMLSFVEALKSNKNSHWLYFSFSVLGLMLTDYMPIFLLPVFPVYVFIKKRKAFTRLVISFTPILLLGVLWLPTIVTQIENYSAVPDSFLFGGATLKQAMLLVMKFVSGRISFEPKLVYYSLVGLASIPVFIALRQSLKNKKALLFWLWFALPLCLGFLASFIFPAFSYFRYIYVLPAFYIIISLGRKILLYPILAFSVVSLLIYYNDEAQQREQWRQAVEYVEMGESATSIALFEFPDPFASYSWYAQGRVDARGATNSILADSPETELKTRSLISNKYKIFYFEYLRDVSDPGRLVEKVIFEEGFLESAKTAEFVGVGAITIYEKTN